MWYTMTCDVRGKLTGSHGVFFFFWEAGGGRLLLFWEVMEEARRATSVCGQLKQT